MSLSNNKNVALSARNIFVVAALAGRASSVRFPVSLKFHRAIRIVDVMRKVSNPEKSGHSIDKKEIVSKIATVTIPGCELG